MGKNNKRRPRGQRQGDKHYAPPKPVAPPAANRSVVPKVENQIQPPEANGRANGDNAYQGNQATQAVSRHVLVDSFFTFVIAVATVVQVGVAWYQWGAMNESNREMIRQSEAAKGQLDVMVEQSKGAAEQSKLAQRQLAAAEGQLKIAEGQLAISSQQATDTLAQMKLQQRPWIKPRVTKFHKPTAGDHARVEMEFVNIGKSPAYVLSYRASVVLAPGPHSEEDGAQKAILDAELDKFGIGRDGDPFETLPPEDKSRLWVMSENHLTQDDLSSLETGGVEVYVIGRVFYLDVGDTECFTEFCLFSDGAGGAMQLKNYNSMK